MAAVKLSRVPSPIWVMLLVFASILVPYLFWQGTWFGRALTDQQLAKYLDDTAKPRHIQHALSQIADRIVRHDPAVAKWYPKVVASANSPVMEVRLTAAWVMGQDNHNEEFHATLSRLIDDPEPMVRRNAALALVRFADARSRPVLGQMVRPYTLTAPVAGKFTMRLKPDDPVNVGTMVARIDQHEVRSPVPGELRRGLQADGAQVRPGDPIVELGPAADQVWEALRALYLVGTREDLPEVERFLLPSAGMPDKIRQQAQLTAQAIRSRQDEPQRH